MEGEREMQLDYLVPETVFIFYHQRLRITANTRPWQKNSMT